MLNIHIMEDDMEDSKDGSEMEEPKDKKKGDKGRKYDKSQVEMAKKMLSMKGRK